MNTKRGEEYVLEYSQQLIHDITIEIDDWLIKKYSEYEPSYELEKKVKDILEDKIGDNTSKEELRTISVTNKAAVRKKKEYWKKNAFLYADKNYEQTKNPFNFLFLQKSLLKEEQWQQLYPNMTLEDAVENEKGRVEEWYHDSTKYLLEYPLINSLKKSMVKKALEQDIFTNITRIIKEKYNNNLSSFFRKIPEFIVDTPIFASNGFNLFEVGTTDFTHIFDNEDGRYQLSVSSNEEDAKMLDITDSIILNGLFTNIQPDFYTNKVIHTTVGELARFIYPGKPTAWHYKSVKSRLKNMLGLQYTYQTENTQAYFNLLQGIKITKASLDEVSTTENVDIIIGDLLFDAIMQKKMIDVTSSDYKKLDEKVSKIICYALQKERVTAYTEGMQTKSYTYGWFTRTMMFQSKNKKKNKEMIKKSLMEFKEKKVIIEDFFTMKDVFNITYLPLTENEKIDLELEKGKEYEKQKFFSHIIE
jgi:hypothetical protein